MSNQRKKQPKQNNFLRFFKVLSRLVHSLPRKLKRNSTLVCAGIIALGIVLSAVTMPKAEQAKPAPQEQETTAPATVATQPTTMQPMVQQKDTRLIEGIPLISQDYYKAGCETYACTMLLQGLGFDIDEHRFIDNYLIQENFSYDDAGNFCGPDMNSAFAGNLYNGAGIFCPAMAKSMNNFLTTQNTTKRAFAIKGKTLSELCTEYIDKGIPVMTWVTTYMDESYEKLSWVVDYVDENAEHQIGDMQTWRQNEHCMVLIGYNDKEFVFNDSVAGKVVRHDKALSETRFKEIGNQAVVVREP